MSTKVGLWIDHRKAIVVAVTNKVEETALITSAVEKLHPSFPKFAPCGPL